MKKKAPKKSKRVYTHPKGGKITITTTHHAEIEQAEKQAPRPVRVRILHQGAELTVGQRNKSYGDAVVNMQHMAGLLTAYFHNLIRANPGIVAGYNLKDMPEAHYTFTGEDAAQIMAIAKMSRTANRGVPYHEDNYTDQAVYSAMAGECADRERPIV